MNSGAERAARRLVPSLARGSSSSTTTNTTGSIEGSSRLQRGSEGASWAMESLLAPSSRALGEESLQMWDLNKRLEAYLARVKRLEDENEALKGELQHLRAARPQQGSSGRGRYGEELAALRDALDRAFREKCAAELARDGLHEEVRRAEGRCQKERGAQEEAKRLLSLGRRELEEERRAQLWLREAAGQLEKEAQALAQAHQEEVAALEQEAASLAWSLEGLRAAPPVGACFQPAEAEAYARQLSGLWEGAVEGYKAEVSQLEASLGWAKEGLRRVTEGNRQSQLQLQQLEQELAALKRQKELLEDSLAQQWQRQHGEAEKLQLAVESLEEEQRSLRVRIAQVLEDRQQLMHLKMSLSLEVATYRTLLEAESTRLQLPAADFTAPSALRGPRRGDRSSQLLQAVSSASLDLQPSPGQPPKGPAGPRRLKRPAEPSALSRAGPLPTSARSPGAREEFQEASHVLQGQPSVKAGGPFGGREEGGVLEAAASALTPGTQVLEAAPPPSLPPARQAPPGQNAAARLPASGASEELGPSWEHEGRQGEWGGSQGGAPGPLVAEGSGRDEEEGEPQGGEAKVPREEPPGESVPPPTQLVAEAWQRASNGVHGQGGESDAEHGAPPSHALPAEEEDRGVWAPSRGEVEGATQEGQERGGQLAGGPGEAGGSPHPGEANGGQEACPEQEEEKEEEEEEAGLWVSREAGPSSLRHAGLPKEEQHGGPAVHVVAADEAELGQEAKPCPPAGAASAEEPPGLLGAGQRQGPEEEPQGYPEEDGLGGKESGEAGPPRGCPDEAEAGGGVAGPEGVSTGALPLSEEEERGVLGSPSRESEAEVLEAQFLPEAGRAAGQLPPSGQAAQGLLSLQLGQEDPRERQAHLLWEAGSASPGALGCEEAFLVGENSLGHKTIAASGEEKAWGGGGSWDAEEGEGEEEEEERGTEEIPRHEEVPEAEHRFGDTEAAEREPLSGVETVRCETLHKEENNLANEDRGEQEGFLEVESTRHEELQENVAIIDQESFSDLEKIGCKDLDKEETLSGNEEAAEPEGFPGTERIGLQEEESSLGKGETLEVDSSSAVERSRHQGLLKDEGAGEEGAPSIVENIPAEDPHGKEGDLGAMEATGEKAGLSGAEGRGHKGPPEGERSWESKGPGGQGEASSHTGVALSHGTDAASQEEEESLLDGEGSEGEQTEGSASHPEEPLPTEQKMEEEEEGISVASPTAEGEVPGRDDSKLGPGAVEMEEEEEEAGGVLEVEARTSPLHARALESEAGSPQSSEARECTAETLAVDEEQAPAGEETDSPSQHTARPEQAPGGEAGQEPRAPPETPVEVADGLEAKDHRAPARLRSQSGSEDPLGPLDASPDTPGEEDVPEEEEEEEAAMSSQAAVGGTLHGHTPWQVDGEQVSAVTSTAPQPSGSEEADQPLPAAQEGAGPLGGGHPVLGEEARPLLPEEQSSSQERQGSEDAIPGTPEPSQDSEGLLRTGEASGRGEGISEGPEPLAEDPEEQPEAGDSLPGSDDVAKEATAPGAQTHEEEEEEEEDESSTDVVGAPEEGGLLLPAGRLGPPEPQAGARAEEGAPPEPSDGSGAEEEEARRVSPLTSVADLGEIVLEGEPAAPLVLGGSQGGGQPSCPQDPPREEEVFEAGASSEDLPEASTEGSAEGLKDSDILEIVEQALEPNPEGVKAAEERADAEGGAAHPPAGEEDGCAATPASEGGESQVPGGAPTVPSLGTKDPEEADCPWVARDTNGLQQGPGLWDLTEGPPEVNGFIGRLPLGQGEEQEEEEDGGTFATKSKAPQEVNGQEAEEGLSTGHSSGHGPPQSAPDAQPQSPREGVLLPLPEGGVPDGRGPEPTCPKGSFSAEVLPVARIKGRDPEEEEEDEEEEEEEALSILPPFEKGLLGLKSVRPLKFRPEVVEAVGSPEEP